MTNTQNQSPAEVIGNTVFITRTSYLQFNTQNPSGMWIAFPGNSPKSQRVADEINRCEPPTIDEIEERIRRNEAGRQQRHDAAIKALVDAVKELIEVAGTANRSSFDQIKDALDGCQGIAEDALAAMEATE